METKRIRTAALLGLASGILVEEGGFGSLHEAAEWISGHPIWTHEFASEALWNKLRDKVFAQVPALEPWCARLRAEKSDWAVLADLCVEAIGYDFEISRGDEARTQSPLATLREVMPDKPVVVIVKE